MSINREIKREINREIKRKDSYLYDYIHPDVQDENYSCEIASFIVPITLCFFLLSCVDISYSYLKLDLCQEKLDTEEFSLSLNLWLRVNGIFGQFYYLFLLISYIKYRPYSENRLRNLSNYFELTRYCVKSTLMLCRLFGTLYMTFGVYNFITYYSGLCYSKAIIYYMWPRVFIGLVSYLSMFFVIHYYVMP